MSFVIFLIISFGGIEYLVLTSYNAFHWRKLNNLAKFIKILLFVGVGFEGTNTKNGSHELKTIKQKGKVARLEEEIARKFLSTFCWLSEEKIIMSAVN